MPTKRELDIYRKGIEDGLRLKMPKIREDVTDVISEFGRGVTSPRRSTGPRKRKMSAWNKYVKANSKKPRFRYRNGKLNLKKMGVAFRKTPAGKKK
jgi:hypothetical protein|tara:strand:- start:727 stop:1014 length:288 start_codon:yes stop_codon:yes gene_type:complete